MRDASSAVEIVFTLFQNAQHGVEVGALMAIDPTPHLPLDMLQK